MQRSASAPVTVRTPAQWGAVTSPVRIELIETMRACGPSSIAELSAMLDRPADSLYHHVRKLAAAGIVSQVAVRRVGRQTEAVFDLACARLEFDYDPATGRNAQRWIGVGRTLLRTAERAFERAVRRAGLSTAGPAKTLWSRVESARLTPRDLARVNALLRELEQTLEKARARGRGRLFSLTLFMFPVSRDRGAGGPAVSRRRRRSDLLELAS